MLEARPLGAVTKAQTSDETKDRLQALGYLVE
jgi:hypothetical protein